MKEYTERGTRRVNVTGMFMGVYLSDLRPVVFVLEGVQFLPIFSTPAKYAESMERAKLRRRRPDDPGPPRPPGRGHRRRHSAGWIDEEKRAGGNDHEPRLAMASTTGRSG